LKKHIVFYPPLFLVLAVGAHRFSGLLLYQFISQAVPTCMVGIASFPSKTQNMLDYYEPVLFLYLACI